MASVKSGNLLDPGADEVGQRVKGVIADAHDDAARPHLRIGAPILRRRRGRRRRQTQRDLNLGEDDVADLALAHEAARFLMHGLVALVEDDAEHDAVPPAGFDRLLAIRDRDRQRLLDQHMLAGGRGGDRVLGMQPVRRRIVEGVDGGIAQHCVKRRMDRRDAVPLGERLPARAIAAHDGDKLGVRGLGQLPHHAPLGMPASAEKRPSDRHDPRGASGGGFGLALAPGP